MADGWILWIELGLSAAALALALWLRPWRMLGGALLSPALAVVVLLPLLWSLPAALPAGLPLRVSGASAVVLMLGWPLAVPVLWLAALVTWLVGDAQVGALAAQLWWLGVLPATLAVALGAALRRWLPPNPFVYTLGRGFLGTAAVVFVSGAGLLAAHPLQADQAVVAMWLLAWGDAFLTGLLCATFVAFAPQWLATWSDARYLRSPPRP